MKIYFLVLQGSYSSFTGSRRGSDASSESDISSTYSQDPKDHIRELKVSTGQIMIKNKFLKSHEGTTLAEVITGPGSVSASQATVP